jgi:hypothetical protein
MLYTVSTHCAMEVAAYKYYSPKNPRVRVVDSPSALGHVIKSYENPRYVNASDLARHFWQKAAKA